MDVLHLSFALCILAVTSHAECNFPPSLWCTSKEIAKECNVFHQCEKRNALIQGAPQVNFTLYYEYLCFACHGFITVQLYPVYKAVGSIMKLDLVPYGNAKETREDNLWKFECQHGKEECVGNVIGTCVIRLLNDISRAFDFIYCMEKSDWLPLQAAKECAKSQPNIPIDKVLSCANGTQGNEWEHEMAVKTKALQPPHRYVPWVTLNGVHTEEIQKKAVTHLQKLICDTYTGPKPQACDTKESLEDAGINKQYDTLLHL